MFWSRTLVCSSLAFKSNTCKQALNSSSLIHENLKETQSCYNWKINKNMFSTLFTTEKENLTSKLLIAPTCVHFSLLALFPNLSCPLWIKAKKQKSIFLLSLYELACAPFHFGFLCFLFPLLIFSLLGIGHHKFVLYSFFHQ